MIGCAATLVWINPAGDFPAQTPVAFKCRPRRSGEAKPSPHNEQQKRLKTTRFSGRFRYVVSAERCIAPRLRLRICGYGQWSSKPKHFCNKKPDCCQSHKKCSNSGSAGHRKSFSALPAVSTAAVWLSFSRCEYTSSVTVGCPSPAQLQT